MRKICLVVLTCLAAAGCATSERPTQGPAIATSRSSAAVRARVASGPALTRGSCFARDAGGNILFDANGRPKTVPC